MQMNFWNEVGDYVSINVTECNDGVCIDASLTNSIRLQFSLDSDGSLIVRDITDGKEDAKWQLASKCFSK